MNHGPQGLVVVIHRSAPQPPVNEQLSQPFTRQPFRNPVLVMIPAVDFTIRACQPAISGTYSPIRSLAAKPLIDSLKMTPQPIPLAPKVFSARLGAICANLSTVLYFSGYETASVGVAAMLSCLSFMDGALGFCMGCVIYQYIVYPIFGNGKSVE
mmetsp:Transcript_26779/g.41894  ORF Transcript_26779/g.41894 Transcript_26779/m.41894 type:complete len:155 (+) Transcript_26779:562-1026(+)